MSPEPRSAPGSDPRLRALLEQRAGLAKLRGDRVVEEALREQMGRTEPATPRDRYLLGHWLVKEGRYRDALPHLWRATQDDPAMFSACQASWRWL